MDANLHAVPAACCRYVCTYTSGFLDTCVCPAWVYYHWHSNPTIQSRPTPSPDSG
jgi:hypothetical protein